MSLANVWHRLEFLTDPEGRARFRYEVRDCVGNGCSYYEHAAECEWESVGPTFASEQDAKDWLARRNGMRDVDGHPVASEM